jgi:hypothetical protein
MLWILLLQNGRRRKWRLPTERFQSTHVQKDKLIDFICLLSCFFF